MEITLENQMEYYEYSKERFNLLKECSEIFLLDKYLENQNFIKENLHKIKEEIVLREGYFNEETENNGLLDSIRKKIKNALFVIWEGILKLMDGFQKMLEKFMYGIVSEEEAYKKLRFEFEHNVILNEVDIERISDEIYDYMLDDRGKVKSFVSTIKAHNPDTGFKFRFTKETDQHSIDAMYAIYGLSMFFAKDKILLAPGFLEGPAIDPNDLFDIIEDMEKAKTTGELSAVLTTLKRAHKDALKNGVYLTLDTHLLDKQIEHLLYIRDKVREYMRSELLTFEAKKAGGGAYVKVANELWIQMVKTFNHTVRLHKYHLNFRRRFLKFLAAWLNNRRRNGNENQWRKEPGEVKQTMSDNYYTLPGKKLY